MTPKKKIMVMEDNIMDREMLVSILKGRYIVLEAENGQECLKLLNQYQDDIALIILDAMMPEMDGYAFLDYIKSDAKLSLIPVIVMTQSDAEKDEVEALSHGATDFMSKPYRSRVILHRIANIIKLRENAALANQFKYDRLTGLFSKDYFCQRVQESLEANPDDDYMIICSNIENFKIYNDSFGVKAGDNLLKELAKAILNRLGSDSICGRFGADRFLLLRKRSGNEQTREKHFQDSWCNSLAYHDSVVMKWGIYEITDRSVPVEQMCDRAFLAVDSIKGKYDRLLAVYDENLRDRLVREQLITDAMEAGLQKGQFTVYLQPKYSLRNDGLAGAEALVRWIHPQLGFMSPGEFIPLFEKNGFITHLDRYVWEYVCAMLRDWKNKGYPSIPVSINVSRADMYQEFLPETLLGLIKEYGLEPAQLHLELTESAYTENPEQILTTVDKLRELGFIVEMDDFGSGYSSLNMLNQMKVDILKLDMKFIQSETAKPTEKGILQFIITLARWLNMSVVAEGVETHAQLERLQEVGCDYVQGYFFAKPMPLEEFEVLLREGSTDSTDTSYKIQELDDIKSILIADDDSDYCEAVRQRFGSDYQIYEAGNMEDAIACVHEHGHNIAVVLLSMELPDAGAEGFLRALRQDAMHWRIPVIAVLRDGNISSDMILHLETDDFMCKCHPLQDLQRRVSRLLAVKAYRERELLLQDEACRDYLTGLFNRRGLFTAVDALRQEDLPLALYLFDVDDLKAANDQMGHEAGDILLRSFGDVLRANTREGDILCRYGGDEFIVVLKRISSEETIRRKGETICSNFRKLVLSNGTHAACSGGVVMCAKDEKPSATLIKKADKALYLAKKENKGSCCLWNDTLEK